MSKKIVYHYRGQIERHRRGHFWWARGYSEELDGGVGYPWMTRQECLRDAKARGATATFVEPRS